MILVKNLNFSVKNKEILQNINFEWSHGILAIIGGNGSGKSTLLGCLSSSLKTGNDCIFWENKPINQQINHYRRSIGYAPQGRGLYSPLSAIEFLSACAILRCLYSSQTEAEVAHVLKIVGLDSLANTALNHFSGGNLRKLLIAQALLGSPELLILDEPTSEVDITASDLIWSRLKDYAQNHSVIVASHDIKSVLKYADKVVVMSAGQLSKIDSPINFKKYEGGGFDL
ncbi:ABC-2 type transport system ATP-binding protein [Zymomonas mobilis]|uniref:ABC-2 type transport system ATP-binding protein n=1 Tax=Zymomonas mobilis TaxID=542 RepID=A0A542VZ06_ZYMMB|nr:ABC transporter ATP-binding protein [Zymomonas mobilis]TQL16551.1 ABC-2 type transport system ATP-binding protein [Zymomonas mobilis]